MRKISIWLFWFLNTLTTSLFAQDLTPIHPTGEEHEGFPVMVEYEKNSHSALRTDLLEKHSVVGEFIKIHNYLQNYLYNVGKSETVEKPYLGLTQNQGGFAKQGFFLKQGDSLIDKRHVYYVDIVEGRIDRTFGELMSVTQLYPHELGHALYRSSADQSDSVNNSFSSHMHYFSLLTDPAIAFNEGFAEHIENIARYEEPNDTLRKQIFENIETIIPRWEHAFAGFRRDLTLPFRYGYYKATMLFWYQTYEDWKRFAEVDNGNIMYHNQKLGGGSLEDQMTYMNSGVAIDTNNLKSYPDIFISEGSVSRFFTLLTRSDLSKIYREKEFYQPFFIDSLEGSPDNLITPIQNQFLKYFVVFDNYLDVNYSKSTQLADFINGYCELYPDECDELYSIFRQATGHEYQGSPPMIWMMAKDHPHRLLVIDAYGGITLPFYTFELNSASKIDLFTLGLGEDDVEKIIQRRDKSGRFNSFEELTQLKGLSEEGSEIIQKSSLDKDYYESFDSPDLTFDALFITPIVSLIIRTLAIGLMISLILWFLFLRHDTQSFLSLLKTYMKNWLLALSFMFVGLAAVILSKEAVWIVSGISGLSLLFTYLISRKNHLKFKSRMLSLGIVCAYTILSLI